MAELCVKNLRDDLAFGARVEGLSVEALVDDAVRAQVNAVFEERGLIVFENVEPSGELQVALSEAYGPLKDHPVSAVPRIDPDMLPGIIDMYQPPYEGTTVEIEGRQLMSWLPWHFDHCYNDELNKAGVLRTLVIPDEGGLTGFADGIELYKAISAELREQIEGCNIIYSLDVSMTNVRYTPKGFRLIKERASAGKIREQARQQPRAIHPAVWTRPTGEKVLHISPWMAEGIQRREDADGAALLAAVCEDMVAKLQPYYHRWSPTDMLIWDNRRMLHNATGTDPSVARRMQRTTIRGDYGLGCFESKPKDGAAAEMSC